jgi:CRP-like cAMP-binding protein
VEPILASADFTPWFQPPIADAESLFDVREGGEFPLRHTDIRFFPGHYLARAGETPARLSVLIDGIATVRLPSEYLIGAKGRWLTPNNVIGLAETVAHRPFQYDVTALTFCIARVIELSDFLAYILVQPEKLNGTLRSLAGFISQTRKALKRTENLY